MFCVLTGWKSSCWSWYCLGSYFCPVGVPSAGTPELVGPLAPTARGWFSAFTEVMSSLLYPDETLGASSARCEAASARWVGEGDAYLPSSDSLELNGSASTLFSLCKELAAVRGENPNLVWLPRGLWDVFVGVGIFVWWSGELGWSPRFSSFTGDTPFIEDDDSVL